jgi:hypothetical protein
MNQRAVLSVVPAAPHDPDRMHRALMGTKKELKEERARRRQAEMDNANLRMSLAAVFVAFETISGAQEELRRQSGLESPNDVLRLASGLQPEQFGDWLKQLRALTRPPNSV